METVTREGTHAIILADPEVQFFVVRGYDLDTVNFVETRIGIISAASKPEAAALYQLMHGEPLHVDERIWSIDEFEAKVAARHASRIEWSRRHPAAA